MSLKRIFFYCFWILSTIGMAQKKEKATFHSLSSKMKEVGPLVGKQLIPEEVPDENTNPKIKTLNKIVPGKGLPHTIDPLLNLQKNNGLQRASTPPLLVFEASSRSFSPSDPTGAIGPNHYVSARNAAFAIHDRNGNVLVPSTSLANIFPGETRGDPIVLYDRYADRFIITQFSITPNGLLVAVCKGPDPVNDGWYTYRFNTGTFPDYPKFSIWSDGYYITANKDQGSQQNSEVVYVLEREAMLAGDESAEIIGFPLPGAIISGFYSPASFNATGPSLPPEGNMQIIYFQDDAWLGVAQDALKLWTINVDWVNLENSTIVESQEIPVSPFDNVFNGGGIFANLPQPQDGPLLDALQGGIMYATNYRRFCNYNSVVLNFVVDIDNRANSDKIAGIRWYELRQNGDRQPWTVHQEGTYRSPDGKSAWSGSIGMDAYGNIGMAYTTVGTIENGAAIDTFVAIRYTGRLADDPLGSMTLTEQTIALSSDINRTQNNRYGDYSHLSIDPRDDQTFWHIAEYFERTGDNVRNIVGVFKVGDTPSADIAIISIDSPIDATLSSTEQVSITLQNFGSSSQTNIPVSYSINGDTPVQETFSGTIGAGNTASYTFNTTADLSATGSEPALITASVNLSTDNNSDNDCTSKEVMNLPPNDVGITDLISPNTKESLFEPKEIIVEITNFGGATQTNIPVSYSLNGGPTISEVYTGSLAAGASVAYTFGGTEDLSAFDSYTFQISTALITDSDTSNDSITRTIIHQLCAPISDCKNFGDGLVSFELSNVANRGISCGTGYENFTDQVINLDKSVGVYVLTVQAGFSDGNSEKISLWIDYNRNNTFENTELLIDNEVIPVQQTDQNFAVTINEDDPTGSFILRVRAGDTKINNGALLNDACGGMQHGTTHDYTVSIGENTNGNRELIVVRQGGSNTFLFTMSDPNAAPLLGLKIYDISGKTIYVNNGVPKDADSRFVDTVDMSYVNPGVYFVKLGSNRTGKSAKFVVR